MAVSICTCRPQIRQISRLVASYFITKRTFVSRRNAEAFEEQRKQEDNVYLLNNRPPPTHTLKETLEVLRAYAISNLDETVELHLKINMGEKKNKLQAFRGVVLLPKPYGLLKTVLVFAEGELAEAAKNAGADIVGGQELFEQVKEGSLKFDQCISTMDMLDSVKSLQRILRQKMPTTRRGTATDDIVPAIKTYKQAHPYRCDKYGFINVGIAKLSFDDQDIKNNASAVIQAVHSHKTTSKGKLITKLMMSSTHGPGVNLHLKELVP